METTGFDQLFQQLDRWEQEMEQALAQGLEDGAEIVQGIAQATPAYQNDTGATRASTVAFVVGDGQDGASVTSAAIAAAEGKSAGSTETTSHPSPPPGELAIVVTSYTKAAKHLEVNNAGERAFLGPSMDEAAGLIDAAIERRAREVRR